MNPPGRKNQLTYAEQNSQLSASEVAEGRFGQLRLLHDDSQSFPAKTLQAFHCLICKAGSEGGWEMLIHNVFYGTGCPICKNASALVDQVAQQFPAHRLVVSSNPVGRPVASEACYQMFPAPCELPDDFGWMPEKLARNSVAVALRNGRRPSEKVERYYTDSVTAYKAMTTCFPAGAIHYSGAQMPGSTSPGPFFSIQTGRRLMRNPVSEKYISLDGLLKICLREQNDQTLDQTLRSHAAEHGAEVLGYEQHPTRRLVIHYKNRSGENRSDTPARVREFYWGQTWIRKAEKLTACIMRELFPSQSWLFNKRYKDFLNYTSPTGNVSALELDGYCPEHQVAFEYQGIQHFVALTDTPQAHHKLEELKLRDAFKEVACRTKEIALVVVPNMDLDPDVFLKTITDLLTSLGRQPINSAPDMNVVWTTWNLACQNPLAAFQAKVVEKLGPHRLIGPPTHLITRNSVVTYECSVCNTQNEVNSRSLAEGDVRSYCVGCKGQQTGNAKNQKRLSIWEQEHQLPRAFIDALRTTPDDAKYFQFVCDQDHTTDIHDPEHAKRHIVDDEFKCPTCRAKQLGVMPNQVAAQAQYRLGFNDNIESLGLKVVQDLPHQNDEMAALVECASGKHTFMLTRPELRRFQRDFFTDRSFIPSACLACCYPGVTVGPGDVLMGTVFHRLASLRGMYPNVSYLSGFDAEGWEVEHFNCGERLPDGSPHPGFSISWRNLQKAGKARPCTHLCNTCGIAHGQVSKRGKSLQDLEAIMVLLRHELHQRIAPSAPFGPPTVKYVEGPLDPDSQIVSSTKTKLQFWCGVQSHDRVIATKDSYFNQAPNKGAGFCKPCVLSAGLTKAPLPTAAQSSRQLLPCTLRDRTKGATNTV